MSIPSWARVGAKVVCINDKLPENSPFPMRSECPPRGGIYLVDGTSHSPYSDVETLLISGYPNIDLENGDTRDIGWRVTRFRPLHSLRKDVAAIKSMLLPADELV